MKIINRLIDKIQDVLLNINSLFFKAETRIVNLITNLEESKAKETEKDNTLELKLKREYLKDTYTVGKLFVNNEYFCDTLEDKYRDLDKDTKVYGETAIPCGTYGVILSISKRFKRVLPEILDVPGFTGIRIHSGNTAKNTEGCILVGKNKIKGGVIDSRITLDSLMDKLADTKKISIQIFIDMSQKIA